MHRRRSRRQGGFTLIEAALTTVIVGTGVLAIVEAQQAFHRKNSWAQRTGTGMLLANEVREMMIQLPLHDPFTGADTLGPEANEAAVGDFDDVDDFAGTVDVGTGLGPGTVFNPPIDALRQQIAGLDDWTQTVTVVNVLDTDISTDVDVPLGTTDLMRVTVTVTYQSPGGGQSATVTQLSWVTSGG